MGSMSPMKILIALAIIALLAIAIYSIVSIQKAADGIIYAGTDKGGDYIMFLTWATMNIQCKGTQTNQGGGTADGSPQTQINPDDDSDTYLVKLYESQQLSVPIKTCPFDPEEDIPCHTDWKTVSYDKLNKKLNKKSTSDVLFHFNIDTLDLTKTGTLRPQGARALKKDPKTLPPENCKKK